MALYRRNTKLYSAPIDDDALLFHQDDLEYFRLNGTGVVIWEYLCEPRSLDEILSMLLERFEVEQESCRSSLIEFIDSLVDSRLLIRD